jgi:hypothetical protein
MDDQIEAVGGHDCLHYLSGITFRTRKRLRQPLSVDVNSLHHRSSTIGAKKPP